MRNVVCLDTVAQIARAALSGTALPSITGKLLSHLPITGIFFAGDNVVTIDEGTGKCVIKPKDAPAGGPALIDATAELLTVGSDTHYLFEWASADSVELRAFLDAQADPAQPVEMRCEIEYAIDGETARIAFPILMQTSYNRPDDPAPGANADTRWEWFKASLLQGSNVELVKDDETKKITINVSAGANGEDGEDGREVELRATGTHIQWRLVGDAEWIDLIALADITGPAGDDGREIEMGVADGYIQWRLVGSVDWINLISLAAITGPAGDDGDDGQSAYEIAVANGFVGDEEAWLASLVGPPGDASGGGNGMADFAFIDTVSGNDLTAVMGDPTKPFLSPNAAMEAAKSYLRTGVMKLYILSPVAAPLYIHQSVKELHVYGETDQASSVQGLVFGYFTAEEVVVIGNGESRINFGAISITAAVGTTPPPPDPPGANGDPGGIGANTPTVKVSNATITSATSQAGTGGLGGSGQGGSIDGIDGGLGGVGGVGGACGNLHFDHCRINSENVSAKGGTGGDGGTGGNGYVDESHAGATGNQGLAGNGGAGGKVYLTHCTPAAGEGDGPALSGAGGAGGSGFSGSGTPGTNGELHVRWSEFASYADFLSGTIRASFTAGSWVNDTSL